MDRQSTILDHHFKDDRMFVIEVEAVTIRNITSSIPARKGWSVTIRRNIPGYPPYRCDSFSTKPEAITYYKSIVTKTPRVSLNKQSPNPAPSLEDYTKWLVAEKLYDPVLNPKFS